MRAIALGLLASCFFAVTFVLNKAMDLSGGSWIWSASLRYFFMVPFLLIIVVARKNLRPLLQEMRKSPSVWFKWSIVGFGFFYAPLCFAAAYGPAWLVAGSFQLTIVAGLLLSPFFFEVVHSPTGTIRRRHRIPYKGLLMSIIILIGVGIMQAQEAEQLSILQLLLGIVPVVIAASAYPLGNRKMMEACESRLDAFQRVLGMTLASLPFWILLSGFGLFSAGLPSAEQTVQALIVAISSGVIATVLFFTATDMAKGNPQQLGSVEATQSGEVIFALIGEVLILSTPIPSVWSFLGISIVIAGMILHSYTAHSPSLPAMSADRRKLTS